MAKPDVRAGVATSTVCPRCRAHRLFRVPLLGNNYAGGRTTRLMCADQVHCLYTDNEVSSDA